MKEFVGESFVRGRWENEFEARLRKATERVLGKSVEPKGEYEHWRHFVHRLRKDLQNAGVTIEEG